MKPHPTMYIIKKGDTLRSICDNFELDINRIQKLGANVDTMKHVKPVDGLDIIDTPLPAAMALYLGKE